MAKSHPNAQAMDAKERALLAQLKSMSQNTLMAQLNIEYIGLSLKPPSLTARMPVGPAVHQPMGFLHGGASAALAESVGSAASALISNPEDNIIFGTELQINHLRSLREGEVHAVARLLHQGRSSHLWAIEISDSQQRLIAHAKLTNRLVPQK